MLLILRVVGSVDPALRAEAFAQGAQIDVSPVDPNTRSPPEAGFLGPFVALNVDELNLANVLAPISSLAGRGPAQVLDTQRDGVALNDAPGIAATSTGVNRFARLHLDFAGRTGYGAVYPSVRRRPSR